MKRFLIGLACISLAGTAAAQDPLSAARDLYASASYEEALVMLTGLRDRGAAAAMVEQVDQYRAFCLFALGRGAEAQKVAESLISKNPMLQLDRAEASPRISAMFSDVRKTLLPGLVREHYKTARAAIDIKDFASAEPEFVQLKAMLEEADRLKISDPTLSDMRLLVDGFLDLTRSSQAASAAKAAPPPVPQAPRSAPPVAAAAAAATPEPQTPPATRPAVYDISASDVTAPVVVVQNVPPIPLSLKSFMLEGRTTLMLDIQIDERGQVERASVRNSRYPTYDELLLQAARNWRYRPAVKDGTPVKYLRTVFIVLQK
jgi:TonB family protein